MIKHGKRTVLATASLLAAGCIAGWVWFPQAKPEVEPTQQALARTQAVSHAMSLVGKVEPVELAMLTAPFDGEVLQRRFDEGQQVEQGQVLVELSSADVDLRLREALAEKLRAEAGLQKLRDWKKSPEHSRANRALANATQNLEETNRRLEETSGLYEKGIVAKIEVDAFRQQQRLARLEQSAAQEEVDTLSGAEHERQLRLATLEQANANDKYATIMATLKAKALVAPFPGIAIRAASNGAEGQGDPARPGVRVAKGQVLLGVASLDRLRIGASVDEIEVRQLKRGQAVKISGETFGNAIVDGEVESISLVPNSMSLGSAPRYDIKVSLPNLPADVQSRISLGMSARIKIITSVNPAAVMVPISAIYSENGADFVRVVGKGDGRVQNQPVQVLHTTTENAEVTGLGAGAIVQTR